MLIKRIEGSLSEIPNGNNSAIINIISKDSNFNFGFCSIIKEKYGIPFSNFFPGQISVQQYGTTSYIIHIFFNT